MKRLLGLTAAIFALGAGPAHAEGFIDALYTSAGDPQLSLSLPSWTGASVTEWRACPPDGAACTPVAGAVTALSPGETAAGTAFEVAYVDGGVAKTKRTPVWAGRVASTAPPGLASAAVTVGQPFQAVPGAWSGGWNALGNWNPRRAGQLVWACPQPDATACYLVGRGGESITLPAQYAGWSVIVEEYVSGATEPGGPIVSASLIPPFTPVTRRQTEPSATVALSRPVVACCVSAAPPAAAPPAAAPARSASVRARALRTKGRLSVGQVDCPVRCTVRLTVSGAGRTVSRRLSAQGTVALTVPPRRGTLKVRVVVDGQLLASGRTVAR
jgi:hypothetical protein